MANRFLNAIVKIFLQGKLKITDSQSHNMRSMAGETGGKFHKNIMLFIYNKYVANYRI